MVSAEGPLQSVDKQVFLHALRLLSWAARQSQTHSGAAATSVAAWALLTGLMTPYRSHPLSARVGM